MAGSPWLRRIEPLIAGLALLMATCGAALAEPDTPDADRDRAGSHRPGAASGLRTTIDDLTKGGTGASRPTPASSRIGRVPRYRQAPSPGAGRTGFVSSNAPRPVAPARPRGGPTPIPGIVDPTLPLDPFTGLVAAPGDDPGKPPPSAAAPGPTGTAQGAATPAGSPGAGPSSAAAAASAGAPAAAGRNPANPTAPPRRKPAPDDDPFDAVGLKAGGFVLRPAIEIWSGYNTNPAGVPGGRGSALVTVSPELQAHSEWERHELTANIRGSYSDYPSVPFANRPSLDAKVDGRIDVTRDTRIDLEARDLLGTDYPGSPNIPADVIQMPVFNTLGGTAGVGQRLGRLDVALKGSVDRTVWQPSQLANGASDSNDDRNFNQYGGQLRIGYELSPAFKPFLSLDADSRIHDLPLDRSGLARDSDGLASRAGVAVDLARVLTGEASIGYLTRLYRDPTLSDIKALIVDGSLAWKVTGLTTVRVVATTTADESVLPGVSGVLARNVELDIDHAFRRWLIGTVRFAYGHNEYVGTDGLDQRYLAAIDLTYKLTRTTQIKGELRQEWLHSNLPGVGYSATVAMVGVRYQP